jgi:phage terminase large subunit-like protein
MGKSLAEEVAALPAALRIEMFKDYTQEDWDKLNYDADFWLRPEQKVPDGDWFITALVAGRGFGKTLTASQWIRRKALEHPGCRIAIAARTVADVRNTMIMGESGVLAVHAPDERPDYKPSTTSLEWPNGSTALLLSSESPDGARGPQFHYAVGDEFAAWKTTEDSSGATLFSNLIAATRLGENPQLLLATTPKRTKVMRDLMEDAKDPARRIKIVRGSTFDNSTLSKNYIDNLVGQYGNSDLAKQELDGMMLEDNEGVVFSQQMIDNATDRTGNPPYMPLRFVAVDPSVAENPNDECGIVVIGVTQERDLTKRTAYILEDYSIKGSPDVWTKMISKAAKDWNTKFVVAERNQGGKLVEMAINAQDQDLKVFTVVATKGKQTRAEPVVVAMQQGRVKFNGEMPDLFDQCVYWDPEASRFSPDRMDAMVWGVIAAMITPPPGLRVGTYGATTASHRKLPAGLGSGIGRNTGSLRYNQSRSGIYGRG